MITVQVDGASMLTDVQGMSTMAELIELIKASIDPDAIITSLTLSGSELTEADWQSPLASHRGRTLEVTTGSRHEYVSERLRVAGDFLTKISEEFRQAAALYQGSDWPGGNSAFAVAVDDLLAFVNWYDFVLQVEESSFVEERAEFQRNVEGIRQTCEKLLQQQLYNSWWALGDTIINTLVPQLNDFERFCERVAGRRSN